MRNLYVLQLDNSLQLKIKKELTKFFEDELSLEQWEVEKELELAMSSRVSDLENTINIIELIDNN